MKGELKNQLPSEKERGHSVGHGKLPRVST